MPLNSTSATSLPPQKLMERCCRTPGSVICRPFGWRRASIMCLAMTGWPAISLIQEQG